MKRKIIVCILSLICIMSAAVMLRPTTGNCAPKRIKQNVKKLTLTKGELYTLRVYNTKKRQTVSFVSDDNTIVAVNTKGTRTKTATLTAVNTGSTVVRANIYSKTGRLVKTLKTTVKVTPYAVSIKFTQKVVRLNPSDTMKLSVIIKPNTSQETPIFESSSLDVASVNSKGVVTAIAPGQTYITATLLSSGQKVTCRVIVEDNEDEPGNNSGEEQQVNSTRETASGTIY